jgi:hypothetical protein
MFLGRKERNTWDEMKMNKQTNKRSRENRQCSSDAHSTRLDAINGINPLKTEFLLSNIITSPIQNPTG